MTVSDDEWRRWLTAELLDAQWKWHQRGRVGARPIQLEGKDLRGLRVAHLRGVKLVACDLSGSQLPRLLEDIELVGCRFDGAQIGGASFDRARIDDCRFTGANLVLARFAGATIRLGSLEGVELENSTWAGAQVRGVTCRGARLVGATLDDGTFTECDLRGALLEQNLPVFADKGSARRTRFVRCDLRGASVKGLRLDGTVFEQCGLANTTGTPIVDGPYTVIDPDLSPDFDGGDLRPPDDIYRLWGG